MFCENIPHPSHQISEFVKRPGLGRLGREIKIRTNFFEITSLPYSEIYHYDISITPEVPPPMNRKVFRQFECATFLGGVKPVFDGHRNIFTAEAFPFGNTASFDVTLSEYDGSRCFNVNIKKIAEISMEELRRFVDGRCSISENVVNGIMALDTLIRHKTSMNYPTIGKSFYINQTSQSISGGVEIWQGYFQSVKPTTCRMMINVDLNVATFYESGSLIEIILKILDRNSVEDLKMIQDREHSKIEKFLKNLKIHVRHHDENISNRKLKITKLTNTSALETEVETDGKITNAASYFQETYGCRLQYPFLPCVIVQKNILLPMEVCNVIGGQYYIRKLNERQTENMIKIACQRPSIRASKINQSLEILNYQENEYLQQFGTHVSSEMVVTRARILPTPKLQYHSSSREAQFTPKHGYWNLVDKKVAVGAKIGSWACVVFGNERDHPLQAIQQFLGELIITCQDTGMEISNQNPPIQYSNPQEDIENSLRRAWNWATKMYSIQAQLILCILPNTGVSLYGKIKRVGDTVIGVATQCIQSKNILQSIKQYYANICLKLNAKLGGINSFIDPSQVPFITERSTIIMGAHTVYGANTSIAALCSSVEPKASRYAASIRVQIGRTEISELAEMVKEQLKNFFLICARKPERILFYRDGIPTGQFYQVQRNEVKAIKAACKSLDVDYNPTITFVTLQKCHHTRFFPMDQKDSDRSENCLPGTVVESTITHPSEFDFYLQSHVSAHGSSHPTHYRVLYDENGFNPDLLQSLSYNLCYVYARSTRAVSIVPPVYYARLACKRAKYHASEDLNDPNSVGSVNYATVNPELQKVMYFI